jgi:heme/copper-type cytochrome/quinol oxidase subunit 2
MDSWWLVAASVIVGLLLLVAVFAATIFFESSWPLALSILALLGYLVAFAVREVRRGKTHPVTPTQQRNHRIAIGVVVVVALIVLWLAR